MDSNYPDWCCDEDSRRALYRQPDRVMAAMIRSDTVDEIEQLERKLEGLYLLLEELDEAAERKISFNQQRNHPINKEKN